MNLTWMKIVKYVADNGIIKYEDGGGVDESNEGTHAKWGTL